jgi:hypothetical protein
MSRPSILYVGTFLGLLASAGLLAVQSADRQPRAASAVGPSQSAAAGVSESGGQTDAAQTGEADSPDSADDCD